MKEELNMSKLSIGHIYSGFKQDRENLNLDEHVTQSKSEIHITEIIQEIIQENMFKASINHKYGGLKPDLKTLNDD